MTDTLVRIATDIEDLRFEDMRDMASFILSEIEGLEEQPTFDDMADILLEWARTERNRPSSVVGEAA